MPEVPALLIERIEGSAPSADGQHLLVRIGQEGGQAFDLAIPLAQASGAIATLMDGFNQCRKVAPQAQGTREVFEPERWEVWPTEQDKFVLSFNLPGGMEMSFQIGRSAASPMAEALRTVRAPTPEK